MKSSCSLVPSAPCAALLVACLALLATGTAHAQSAFLLDRDGNRGRLTEVETAFVQSRFDEIDLSDCRREALPSQPRVDYRRLEIRHDGVRLHLHVAPDVLRTNAIVLYADTPEGPVEYTDCKALQRTSALLPVLALIVSTPFEQSNSSSVIRQRVLAENSGLTSHHPNYLIARYDSDDIDAAFMDFTVSFKHAVFPNATPINEAYDWLTETVEQLAPGDDEYYLQMYLAFTGRFSQYLFDTRNSSPVVARRFNPELFFRMWSSGNNYMDFGFGHESNGQRIDNVESFLLEQNALVNDGDPAWFARDSLSRGWDYTTIGWRRSWNDNFATTISARHYFSDGPLQGAPEEYNLWEDGGVKLRPRRRYDGVTFDFEYNFNASRCLLGKSAICLDRLQLTQETGYNAMFEHNTTSLELTTDFFGMPLQVWARTGYMSDLVDYYSYSNSVGLGIELLSR
jgi:hypothetical protein